MIGVNGLAFAVVDDNVTVEEALASKAQTVLPGDIIYIHLDRNNIDVVAMFGFKTFKTNLQIFVALMGSSFYSNMKNSSFVHTFLYFEYSINLFQVITILFIFQFIILSFIHLIFFYVFLDFVGENPNN